MMKGQKKRQLLDLFCGQSFLIRTITRSNSSSSRGTFSVVSGASKGIGLEFTKQLLLRPNSRVIALSRTSTDELGSLLQLYPEKLHWICTDLCDESSIKNSIAKLKSISPTVDLLINSAGILGDNTPSQPGPERSVSSIEKDWLLKTFQVNLFGHVLLTKEITPLLKQRNRGHDSKVSKVINISARVGSISDNRLGGWYSYRMSKAALNMFTKTLSQEMKRYGVAVVSVHPGTTDTSLSKPFQKNVTPEKLFSVECSVKSMLDNVVDKVSLDETGKFYAYDGSVIEY